MKDTQKTLLKTTIEAILAGLMISIGALVYLNCPNNIVGAFLFSIGLLAVNKFRLALYTGKVGFARTWKDALYLLLIIAGNAVGCLIMMAFTSQTAQTLFAAKLATPLWQVFVKGIVCGVLIYICAYNKDQPLYTLVAVPTFILCGAEHSIADIGFLFAAKAYSWQSLGFIAVVIAGNAVGALVVSLLVDAKNKLGKKQPTDAQQNANESNDTIN